MRFVNINRLAVFLIVMLTASFNAAALDVDINKTTDLEIGFSVKSIVVGSPEIADFRVVDENHIYIFGKKSGQTNLSVNGTNGESQTLLITVNDLQKKSVMLNTLLISEGFKDVKVIDMSDSLLVSGPIFSTEDGARIKSLIEEYVDSDQVRYSLVTQKNQQIKIRVTVAEVSKDVTETLGIDWGRGKISTGVSNDLTINNGIYSSLVKGFNFDSLGVAINALAKNSLANVLTTPSITVTNGKTASFHGGGQIPIFQRSENGSTVEWKNYGVMLNFAPVINSDSSISMDVSVESSQIGGYYKYENTELPTINVRNVKTSVRMRDGESFVLGGLIDNSQTQYVNKVPGFADIPVLGALFKSTGFTSGRSELVIFATVEYVKPVERNYIKLPYAKFSSPWEVFFDLGHSDNSITDVFVKGADYVIN
ncbi:type II and III secretion system protein family protein [Serratia marcescens]|uniref:type II and III secretion system protein family protein n=1 Tax=Serratia marcescens TaxID=615 RepID=UPI000745531F|nr:pilus assembly protein N-terminal domain-containing protein [Serratia marcescens]MCM2651981.1 pilus assembly protein N-terminal domain-containing protein [Serratia marcescens]MDM8342778.1 pilus assembly protein N-terminal domain-containing protein [Serratia marcescens]UOO24281.1 pilus assembly protein N-terminal domain-containing protein [Serratia marcescens]CUZ27494.1 Pullulanase secretion envelope pulD [Serratia marcescens]BEL82845.1 secretin [Serratia marcescens]